MTPSLHIQFDDVWLPVLGPRISKSLLEYSAPCMLHFLCLPLIQLSLWQIISATLGFCLKIFL